MSEKYYMDNIQDVLSTKNRLVPFSLYQEPEEYDTKAIDKFSDDVARNAVASMFVADPEQLDTDFQKVLHNMALEVENQNSELADYIRSYKPSPELAQEFLIALMNGGNDEQV